MTLKEIIEKTKNIQKYSVDIDDGRYYGFVENKDGSWIEESDIENILPDLEKSAEQETELIKALVNIKNVYEALRQKNMIPFIQDLSASIYEMEAVIKSYTGKKWDEIKEVYK